MDDKQADYNRALAEASDLATRSRNPAVVDGDGRVWRAVPLAEAGAVGGSQHVALPDGQITTVHALQRNEADAKRKAEQAADAVIDAERDVADARNLEAAYRRDAEAARHAVETAKMKVARGWFWQRRLAAQWLREAEERLQALENDVRRVGQQTADAERHLAEARLNAVESATNARESARYRQ